MGAIRLLRVSRKTQKSVARSPHSVRIKFSHYLQNNAVILQIDKFHRQRYKILALIKEKSALIGVDKPFLLRKDGCYPLQKQEQMVLF